MAPHKTTSPMMTFSGIYTPLVTPFHEGGSINYDALSAVIENLIDKGVHGLISGGSTGENYAQSVAERLEIARFTKEQIRGRLPLIVGTGAMMTSDSIDLARGAREMGAEAILVATPPYSVPTEEENALNALAIDRAADLPIMLYNYPARMGVSMGETFLDRVGGARNVCAIKESSGDINRLHLLAREYPHIQMACGMDDQALEFFAWGAQSWVCAGSNFLPEEHIALYQACVLEGNYDKGRRIMSAMMPLMRVLEQGGKFIQCVKQGVTLNGIDSGPMRPPLLGLDQEERQTLEQVIRQLRAEIATIRAEG
ncbi:dihydrodipicolinate synthase family protein [Kiloniella laminariae]|uniref:dihydrodipicolinate synthase family protein n=1 Tax=Kiloniella laminariae TaxID=454162 RepID=UPI000377ED2E|nr:dihydrodipicolinate synthase family protein [Kiloniella laminariae]